jgi:hypothetical protein
MACAERPLRFPVVLGAGLSCPLQTRDLRTFCSPRSAARGPTPSINLNRVMHRAAAQGSGRASR